MWTFIKTLADVTYAALIQAALAESDPDSWVGEPEGIVLCIRPDRAEATPVLDENAA